MRVLLVSHVFLPKHPSGTEIYTYQVGRQLLERGHDAHIFTTEKDIAQPNLSVHLREYDGLPVHELYNNLFYNRFEETWDYPPAVQSFGHLLDDLQPDIVHFMHLMYLSVGCVEEVARRGIPVIYTLHDYWLQCARFGQRIHADGSICHTIDFDRCGDCLTHFKFKQTRLERMTAKAVAQVHSATGLDLGPAARAVAGGVKSFVAEKAGGGKPAEASLPRATAAGPVDSADDSSDTPGGAAADIAVKVRERDRALRERLLPVVYRFLAPSHFLRERMLEWGIPKEQIHHMRTGIDLGRFRGLERSRSDKLRVAYIGTLAPHKGVHILMEAWELLPNRIRARGELTIYGPLAHNPSYLRKLQTLAGRTRARMAGGLRRSEVVDALAHVDLLVVPSVWYENSPLIILEALATRTPLLVSDLGGMAELVEVDRSGYHFRVGDAAHLCQQLGRLLEDPGLLDELYRDELPVKDVATDAVELEQLYEEALRTLAAAKRGGGPGGASDG